MPAVTIAVASLLAGCKETVAAITPREAHERAARGELLLVDIRRPDEWRQTGVAAHAVTLDMTERAFIEKLKAARAAASKGSADFPVALICRTANRSSSLQEALLKNGFTHVIDVKGGMAGNMSTRGWLAESLPIRPVP
ncbi:MAG: rhodanese-like domain-containing protein [Beijerinckiaceae bacterium]